ncbi:MAG: hypothetical protein AAF572_08745 [Cyanobacteria bacterium P01_B01_bin.77]
MGNRSRYEICPKEGGATKLEIIGIIAAIVFGLPALLGFFRYPDIFALQKALQKAIGASWCYSLEELEANRQTVHLGDESEKNLNEDLRNPVWVAFPEDKELLKCYEIEFELASIETDVEILYAGYGIKNVEVSLNGNPLAYKPNMSISGWKEGNYQKEMTVEIQEEEKRFFIQGENTLKFVTQSAHDSSDPRDWDDLQVSKVSIQRTPRSSEASQ